MRKIFFCVLLCSFLSSVPVHAQVLIQTVSDEDELLSMIHLDMLEVETGKDENLQKAEKNNENAVVLLNMGSVYGSGVVFEIEDENIVILSNRHVLNKADKGTVIFADGYEAEGITAALSEETDLGIMLVKRKAIPLEEMLKIRKVSVSKTCYKKMKKGNEICMVASADGAAKSVTEGKLLDGWWYLEEFGEYMLYNDCYAKPGMSGGGTFDAHGHYIGMITGGNGTESVSLPLTTVLEEYEQLTMEFSE